MNLKYFENLIEQKLLTTHTCYLAKVLSENGSKATIQPLSMIKAVGGTAKRQTVIENVPISQVVLHALDGSDLVGRVAIVMCAERDISRTRLGEFALPSLRRHSLSDSIIIGYL